MQNQRKDASDKNLETPMEVKDEVKRYVNASKNYKK